MICLFVGQLRCSVSGREARGVCIGRRDAQGVGRRDRRMRGDAERALLWGAARCLHLSYICDVSSLQVICVAVFPDGRRVVSGSRDTQLNVWDVATGKCVATLEGHTSYVSRAASASCCTFFMICIRCRSIALPCFPTGSVSCLGRPTTHSRCGSWRRGRARRR